MIYCVEDDSSSRELMLYTLKTAGFRAEGFPDAGSFHRALRERVPDLVILDIMLPDEDGITILKKLRRDSRTEDLPVIMATAKGTEYDKVIGLDLGADDYLAKPFGMMEMVSRVKAVLRRAGREKEQKQNVLRIGGADIEGIRSSEIVHGESGASVHPGSFVDECMGQRVRRGNQNGGRPCGDAPHEAGGSGCLDPDDPGCRLSNGE